MRSILIGVLLATTVAGASEAKSRTAYHVGNSLTIGLPVDWIVNWANARGHQYRAGRHAHNGASLNDIWQWHAPTEFPLPPYSHFYNSLPSDEFDALTLEPFFDPIEVAEARIADFSALAQHTDQVYVYQIWPHYSYGDYRTNWDKPYSGGTTNTNTRDYYRQLMDRLPESTRIIPTGEVFYELAARVQSGTLGEFDAMQDFYAIDNCTCHLNSWGNFVLASTVYAIMFEESPVGLSRPVGMSDEAGLIIQEVAWHVASNHLRSGMAPTGDFDADGEITLDDYARWRQNYHVGISDASGYTIWRNAFDSAGAASAATIAPEPAACLLVGSAILFLWSLIRRIR